MTPLGIIMLDTRFARIPGDIGAPASFAHPVLHHVVRGADPARVVAAGAPGLAAPFEAAARRLERRGAQVITTSCGFLAPFQTDLQAAVAVPVLTSALFEVPVIARGLPAGQVPGILTISARSLGPAHLDAAGIGPDIPIGAPDPSGSFVRGILGNAPGLDPRAAAAQMVAAARALVHAHPRIGALVLECTNMPPYARAVEQATGRPVHTILTALRRRFPGLIVPADTGQEPPPADGVNT